MWQCQSCEYVNRPTATRCHNCGKLRPPPIKPKPAAIFGLACILFGAPHAAAGNLEFSLSQGALIGAETADAASSWQHPELNAILADAHGRFGVKGVTVKGGVTAGLVLAERPLTRRWPRLRREFTILNWAAAAVTAGAAAHNLTMGR